MPGTIQLVLPGLFDLPLDELDPQLLKDGLPALNRLLRLATPQPNRAFSIDAMLGMVLKLESSDGESIGGLPLAQAFACAEAGTDNRMLLFQALHLRADLHSAIAVPIRSDEEGLRDISIVINDLKETFKVDCDIDAVAEGLFLMRLKAIEAPAHYPHILSILGKPVNPYIEQSRQNLPWYQLLNEMQMFMHQHEINQARAGRGQLPINSLWFWGAGSLPARHDSDLAWYCDDPLLNRFAGRLALDTEPLDSLGTLERKGNAAVIDLRLLESLKSVRSQDPGGLLQEIDRKLLATLLRSVNSDRKQLCLRAGYEFDYCLTPGSSWKFWRRARGLGDLQAAGHGV